MKLIQQAKEAYPVSIMFKGRLSKEQVKELEKTCDIRCFSVYMDGSAAYSIRYNPELERDNNENQNKS